MGAIWELILYWLYDYPVWYLPNIEFYIPLTNLEPAVALRTTLYLHNRPNRYSTRRVCRHHVLDPLLHRAGRRPLGKSPRHRCYPHEQGRIYSILLFQWEVKFKPSLTRHGAPCRSFLKLPSPICIKKPDIWAWKRTVPASLSYRVVNHCWNYFLFRNLFNVAPLLEMSNQDIWYLVRTYAMTLWEVDACLVLYIIIEHPV